MRKILIAENDMAIGMAYLRTFVVDGYQVEQATGEMKAGHLAAQFKPDIAIVSLQFTGAKGIRIIERIASDTRGRAIPIVAYSRNEARHLEDDALAAGAQKCVFIGTPGTDELRQVVRAILEPPPAEIQPDPKSEPPKSSPSPAPPIQSEPSARRPPEAKDAPKPPATASAPNATAAETSKASVAVEPAAKEPDREKPPPQAAPSTTGRDLLAKLKELSQSLLRTEDKAVRPIIEGLYALAKKLKSEESAPSSRSAERILNALTSLLKDLTEDPEIVGASIRRTILQSADFLNVAFNEPGKTSAKDNREFRILAVDDELIARKLIAGALESVQLTPDSSEDPLTALEELKKTRFDLFILDVHMPRMSGFELCQQIRRQPFYSKTPIIFVTSASDFKSRLKFAQSGGDDFIAKPFLPNELATKALLHLLSP